MDITVDIRDQFLLHKIRTTVIYQPALVSLPAKVAFPELLRVEALYILYSNGKTSLKNSWLPKAFTTWKQTKEGKLCEQTCVELKISLNIVWEADADYVPVGPIKE